MLRLAITCTVATLLPLAAATAAHAQGRVDDRAAEVAGAFAEYATLLRRMDNAGIANLFVADGAVVNPGAPRIVGPAAIKAYLDGFAAYRVLGYDARVDSIAVRGDSAAQFAHFTQRVRIPAGDTVTVSGRLRALWVRTNGRWRVAEMGTTP